ncbi:hypothetical protein AAMO2058_001338600 [Amorphochlora amoebiformis]
MGIPHGPVFEREDLNEVDWDSLDDEKGFLHPSSMPKNRRNEKNWRNSQALKGGEAPKRGCFGVMRSQEKLRWNEICYRILLAPVLLLTTPLYICGNVFLFISVLAVFLVLSVLVPLTLAALYITDPHRRVWNYLFGTCCPLEDTNEIYRRWKQYVLRWMATVLKRGEEEDAHFLVPDDNIF